MWLVVCVYKNKGDKACSLRNNKAEKKYGYLGIKKEKGWSSQEQHPRRQTGARDLGRGLGRRRRRGTSQKHRKMGFRGATLAAA